MQNSTAAGTGTEQAWAWVCRQQKYPHLLQPCDLGCLVTLLEDASRWAVAVGHNYSNSFGSSACGSDAHVTIAVLWRAVPCYAGWDPAKDANVSEHSAVAGML